MAKIFFWSGAQTDACSFYRCHEPARALRKLGHETTSSPSVGMATLLTSDVVVFQRPTEPPTRLLMEKLLTLPEGKRPRIVVELDDDLFALPEHHPAHPMMEDPKRRYRLTEAIRQADRVTVTNSHLSAQLGLTISAVPSVRVVPNYVPERFVVDRVPALDAIGTPTLTWAGSDTHRRDFDELALALRKLLRERTDFRVRIVGAPYADRLRSAVVGDQRSIITQVPWLEGVPRYITTLAGHIGLAPLADDLFNRSKSDLRLRELAARGMAVVASHVGPYADSPVPRLSPNQGVTWEETLTLALDVVMAPEGGVHPGSHALAWAQRNTLEAHAGEWEKALLD